MVMIPAERRRRVAGAVKKAGAEALLVTHLPDVRYLTGFTGSSAALLMRGARATMFTDGRYTTQAADEVDGAKVVIVDRPATMAACEFAAGEGVTRLGFDAGQTTVAALEGLKAGCVQSWERGRARDFFVPTNGLIAGLREVKDEVEQEKMREAAALGCRLFEQALEEIHAGATETEVALALWSLWRGWRERKGCRLRRLWRAGNEARCRMDGRRMRSCQSGGSWWWTSEWCWMGTARI